MTRKVLSWVWYDARKAYEGQRRVMKPTARAPEDSARYGVEILWPVLLLQTRMLRQSLAYIHNTKWQQAVAYNLEAIVESDAGGGIRRSRARAGGPLAAH